MSYRFFEFHETNSFGKTSGRYRTVIVEASSPDVANDIAVSSSEVYFDGVEEGIDCPCCGDRWNSLHSKDKGTTTPCIYGTPIFCAVNGINRYRFPALVVFRDGRKEEFRWRNNRVYKVNKNWFRRFLSIFSS